MAGATDQVSQTRPQNEGRTDVPVAVTRKVTYILKTGASNLSMPYAVAVDGVVQKAYRDKPARVSGASGKIVVQAAPGAKVTLYLNSDAHPSHRKEPVYLVTPAAHDVEVKITEKTGKHSDADTPTLVTSNAAKKLDSYTAPLTGDIWMKISHKYAASEVDALVPAGTGAEVKTAVQSIYNVLAKAELTLTVAATATKPATQVVMTFADSNNPKENITAYGLLKDGLTRVHPGGFAALLNAAIAAGVTKLTMSSAWRPILGSIAHRAGLGLDVNYVGDTRMNREELRKAGAVDTSNVSAEEKRLLKEFEAAKAPQRGAAQTAWAAERDANEPAGVRAFRVSLAASPRVAQLFDPWFMDANTQDQAAATSNMQQSANETLHAHHLHVTVREPKIL